MTSVISMTFSCHISDVPSINHMKISLKDGFDIDLTDISDQWTSKNGDIPDQHNLLGAKFSTFDKVI